MTQGYEVLSKARKFPSFLTEARDGLFESYEVEEDVEMRNTGHREATVIAEVYSLCSAMAA
jgi:hypothetical protein